MIRDFRRTWRSIVSLVLASLMSCLGGAALALDDSQAVSAAHDQLSQPTVYPWYDPQTDRLKSVPVAPHPDPPAIRDWQWSPRKSRGNFNGFADLVEVLFWTALGALLVWLAWLIVRTYLQRSVELAGGLPDATGPTSAADDARRVERLPFPVKRSQTDLLGQARRYYRAGDYAEAIVYLFSYQLVHLDKHDLIRLAKGKTNRQYLREIRLHREIREILYDTMTAFEDVFFGRHPLPRGRFEVCWNRLDQFHGDVRQAAEAATVAAGP